MKQRKKAFTLAELLVIVAVIGVLTAVAIPVFSASTNKSKLAADHANIRAAYGIARTAEIMGTLEVDGDTYSVSNLLVDKSGGESIKDKLYFSKVGAITAQASEAYALQGKESDAACSLSDLMPTLGQHDKDCYIRIYFTGNGESHVTLGDIGGGPEPTPVTVTFHGNYTGAEPITPVTLTAGETVTPPTVTRAAETSADKKTDTDYTLAGWYTDAACTTPFTLSTPVTGNMDLYANWTAKNYTRLTLTASNLSTVGISSTDPDPVIPSTYKNGDTEYRVVALGQNVFKNRTDLVGVTLPDSLEEIGIYAFNGCTGLTSVSIPKNVTVIRNMAFYQCSNLASVTIPSSVKTIGDLAFANTGLTSVAIPEGTISIGDNAFYNCQKLTTLSLGNTVTTIGEWAFCNCFFLTSVTIPNSVTTIEEKAFYQCIRMTQLTLGTGVTSIGVDAFKSCYELTGTVEIPNGVTSIPERAFENCEKLSINVPSGVTTIGNNAFYNVQHVSYTGTATGSPWGAKALN